MEVVLRATEQRVTGIRVFSEDCAVDAGGANVVVLKDVAPRQSLDFLASLVTAGSGDGKRLQDSAVMAIAFHDDPAADATLDSLAAPAQPDAIREKAAFWMGAARGERGYPSLKRLLAGNGTDRFREKVVFALSISHVPGSVETLLDTARRDPSSRVRGQALFWLAQAAGAKAAEGISRAIAEDPETDVKKKAVFALSQLPKEQGVPLLVQTARTNRNPVVRKEAMFWLGQSNDPRALAFFQEVLGH
jgi:HEAT repeat protein